MKNPIYRNSLKEKMKSRPVFGMTMYTNCPQLIECMAYAGFDFAFIDAEHCPWETTSLREAVLAARAAGISQGAGNGGRRRDRPACAYRRRDETVRQSGKIPTHGAQRI